MIRQLAALLVLTGAHFAAAAPLDPLLTNPGLWTMKPADFEGAAKGLGFRWTSQARDSARAAGRGMTVFGLPAVEAVVRFESEKVKEFTIAIYARGDAGGMSKEAYSALISKAVEALDRSTGVKFGVRGKDSTNAV